MPNNINRRKFIQQSAVLGGTLLTSSIIGNAYAEAPSTKDTLTILHTNDVHSRLDPFPMDGSKNAGLGGVAARANIIKQIRQETDNGPAINLCVDKVNGTAMESSPRLEGLVMGM